MEEQSKNKLLARGKASKWKYTAEFWDNTNTSGNGKTVEASLRVLGLNPSERSWKTIKHAFFELTKKWHPDRYLRATSEGQEEYALVCRQITIASNYLREVKRNDTPIFKT